MTSPPNSRRIAWSTLWKSAAAPRPPALAALTLVPITVLTIHKLLFLQAGHAVENRYYVTVAGSASPATWRHRHPQPKAEPFNHILQTGAFQLEAKQVIHSGLNVRLLPYLLAASIVFTALSGCSGRQEPTRQSSLSGSAANAIKL